MRAAGLYQLLSFFFKSIIKWQIKIFMSSAGMSSIPPFSLMLRINLFQTFKSYSVIFLFQLCFLLIRLKCSSVHLSFHRNQYFADFLSYLSNQCFLFYCHLSSCQDNKTHFHCGSFRLNPC